MKGWEICRFELAYQLRRPAIASYFATLAVIAFLFVRGNFLADALYADFFVNAPFVIAAVSVLCSLFGFLITAGIAGEAGARDVATGMHPMLWTSPVSKAEYLGGRYLAAVMLNLLVQLAVPIGVMVAVYGPGVDPVAIGPFRPAAYLTAFGAITLPNVVVGTAIQFAWAVLGRRSVASYFGSVLLFFVTYGGMILMAVFAVPPEIAALLDVFGHVTMTSDLILGWTPIEKNTRLITLEGTLLHSRLVWAAIAFATLMFTYARFRFAHVVVRPWWRRSAKRAAQAPVSASMDHARPPVVVPHAVRTFGLRTWMRQTFAIAGSSFTTIAWRRAGLILLAVMAGFAVLLVPPNMENMGTPMLPTTDHLLTVLTARLGTLMTPWMMVPVLIVIMAGELVWREREAGTHELVNATPTPEWALFIGKFLGLALFLAVWMAMLALAGVLIQLRMGYHAHELGLSLRVLFGLQLPEYLLFAALALAVHVIVDRKYIGLLVGLLLYAGILFSAQLGVHHNLLVFGSHIGWSYSDMRGFGGTIGPWAWFKLYWAMWAVLLAVAARLLWARGVVGGAKERWHIAWRRLTRATRWTATVAILLLLLVGGFIFWNTNVLNEYGTPEALLVRRAEYEQRYGRFAHVPRPELVANRSKVEIHPAERAVTIEGTYRLENHGGTPIDSIHVATVRTAETEVLAFDRPATLVIQDDDHGHRTYVLQRPLQPGDALEMRFTVRRAAHGFTNNGVDRTVFANGTFFESTDLQPMIGYQPKRELLKPGERRKYGLPARPVIASVDDVPEADVTGESHGHMDHAERIAFEAVVGTDTDQIAVAPGTLRDTWTEGNRRYFHYVSDVPIGNEQRFFSARYAVRELAWKPVNGPGRPVTIRMLHHPSHTANVDRMLASAVATLAYGSEQFGPYPFGQLTIVENPGNAVGAHAEPAMIDHSQGFARFDPVLAPGALDLPFAVMAHEMGHQWWGAQLAYAPVEGVGLLTESAAWYTAMGVIERTHGRDHLRRLLRFFRQPYPFPPIRQSVPLLRAADPYAAYRRGPFALFAMGEYMGHDRVNTAYRRLLEAHLAGQIPLPTSLDLYRELHAVTPDTLRPLLHDLFEANTLWDLSTERPSAVRTPTGEWEVIIPIRARKMVVDPDGTETALPMDEWVQVGVFAPAGQGGEFGATLYLRMHRIRSGESSITVTVPSEPADAGIDPYHLLFEMERYDNVEEVRR